MPRVDNAPNIVHTKLFSNFFNCFSGHDETHRSGADAETLHAEFGKMNCRCNNFRKMSTIAALSREVVVHASVGGVFAVRLGDVGNGIAELGAKVRMRVSKVN